MNKEDKRFSKIFLEKRHCESDWFILRSKDLIDLAKRHNSLSALIYAALEARKAVEQLWFELIVACHKGKISKKLVEECRKTDGIFRVMQKTEPDYRKLVRFCSICRSVYIEMPIVIEWDQRKLVRFWNSLSKYCHSPMSPVDTYESSEWFNQGLALLNEVYDYISSNMKRVGGRGGTGVIDTGTMPEEVKQAWEAFKSDSISEDQLYHRLKIMFPVLQMRTRRF